MSSGQLILCGENERVFEPVNNKLRVGSQETANVVLSGLKNLAFIISIDNFGRTLFLIFTPIQMRLLQTATYLCEFNKLEADEYVVEKLRMQRAVTISNYTKRVKINEKRIPKNIIRPLINGSTIEISDYKFLWKYNTKLSRSYSLSPCKKPPLISNVEFTTKNRKTMSCIALQSGNDENEHENVPTVAANEEVDNFIKPSPAENDNLNVTASAKKRKSLLPVKENRTSELRRASIVRSLSISDVSKPLQFITPKKPIPSATMAKSVNAILRSEGNVVERNATRKTLGSTDFPNIVEKMNLFKVVTDDMKTVGPNTYIANKSSAKNSPRRTPKKTFLKQKRLSLRSEVTEMGIWKRNPTEGANCSEDAGPTSTSPTKEADDANIPVENDVVQPTQRFGSSTSSSVETYDNTMECLTISDEEDEEVISSDKIIKQESADMFDNESSDSSFSVISVDDDSNVFGDTVTEDKAGLLTVKTPNNRTSESPDVDVDSQLPKDRSTVTSDEFQILNENDDLVEGTPSSSQSHTYEKIQEDVKSETVQTEEVKTPSEQLPETLQEVIGATLPISTPTKRQSLIRTRRNSRLCSLEQCCSPAPSTPSKIKLTTSVISTPKSILKTPKPSKTPKKSVRILDTIFHEDEDEARKSTNNSEAEAPKLNTTFEKGCDVEIGNLSVGNNLVASTPQSSIETRKENRKSTNNSEAEEINLNTTFDKECDNDVDNLFVANNVDASTSQSIIEAQKEVRKSTINSVVAESNLNTTFDEGCDSEIDNLSVGNNVVASTSQSIIEAQKEVRKSTSNSESEEINLNTTFDKECHSEIDNLSVDTNVVASMSESNIEAQKEVRKSTSNSAAEESNLNTTFDKGCDNEVDNLSVVASTSQSNTDAQEQVRKSTHNAESEASTFNTTFDKGCDDEIDRTSQSNTEDQKNVRKSTNHSKYAESNLNATFDMESDNEIDNLSVASTSQANENTVPEKSDEEQCNYAIKEEKDLTAMGEILEKTQETVESIQLNLSDVVVKTERESDNEVSGTAKLMSSSQSSGQGHELQLTNDESVPTENHSNDGFSLDDNEKSEEPTTSETPNVDATFDEESENVQSNESIDGQSNEIENEQHQLSSDGKENTSGLDEQSHPSESHTIVNIELDSNNGHTLSENMDAVEPMITEITSEASNLNATIDMGCDNEINNQSEGNSVASTSQSSEEISTVAAEMQLKYATTEEKDSIVTGADSTQGSVEDIVLEETVEDIVLEDSQVEKLSEKENSKEECEDYVTNPLNKTNLTGMKELLKTPKHTRSPFDDLRGVKELVNTPTPLDKTNLIGMKELLNTPDHSGDQFDDFRGVKELVNTPKPLDKTNLIGMKELLNTPDQYGDQFDDLRGVKELMNTPKLLDKTNLVGMKELLNTPDNCGNQLEDLRGVKELLTTPKQCKELHLEGLKEMVQTPAAFYTQPADKPAVQSSSNVLQLKDINYSSRLSLVNKLNNALSGLGLKVKPSTSDSSADNISEEPQLEPPIIPEQHEPAPVKVESNVTDSTIITESIPSTVIEIPTSSKDSITSAATTDDENAFKVPLRPAVNKVEKESRSVRNRTKPINHVDASKTMELKDDKSSKGIISEGTIVAHSSEKINDDESEATASTRKQTKKPAVVDISKSSKSKDAKSTKGAKVTTTSNTERNVDEETLETATDEDEPTVVTRKRTKKQAVVDKSSKSKDTKSTKATKVPTTSNTDRKTDENNTPKVDSQENVGDSDATAENDSELTRKGSKKAKEVKSKKGKNTVDDVVAVAVASKIKSTETLKSVEFEHTPTKRSNRKAKQNIVDEPKEEIEPVNTLNVPSRRTRKVNFVNEAPGPIDADIGALQTDKKTKTSAIQKKSIEMSVQNEPSKSTSKRNVRSAKTNVADEPEDVGGVDTAPEDAKISDNEATTWKNAGTKKPIKSATSSTDNANVPTRKRNAESVTVDASSRTQRKMRSAKNTGAVATTELEKVAESTPKSQTTAKRRRQASEVDTSDVFETLGEKQPSKRSKRKVNNKNESEAPMQTITSPVRVNRKGKNAQITSSTGKSEADDVKETSTSSTALKVHPENSQTSKTHKSTTVLTRRARKVSESVESLDSIEVPKLSQPPPSRTRSKRNINPTATAENEDAPVLKKRPKRGNK